MANSSNLYRGGCLCGALRYEAQGEPDMAGHCYCGDCRKASGSGFIPFVNFASAALTITGPSRPYVSLSARGTDSTRNYCATCGSLVFGGERDLSDSFTIYAGTLDNPAAFRPQMAIFTVGRPDWAQIPEGLTIFERLPE
tara:strand:+ start:38059 stop:38478 length:420 start_codon:yes stop_codon:yes gene_type:complete